MKKSIVLLSTGLLLSTAVFAQKANINKANNLFESITEETKPADANAIIEKAKAAVDLAIANESTKANAEAWYAKAKIYAKSATLNNSNTKDIEAASDALKKAFELNPKISSKEDFNFLALELGINNYNIGQSKFQANNFAEAKNNFSDVTKLVGEKPSDAMKKIYPSIDTINTYAKIYYGLTAFNTEDLTSAEAVYKALLSNPIAPKEQVIGQLVEISSKAGDKAKTLEYIQLGRKEMPTNENFAALETNYYIDNNMTDKLLENLKVAGQNDPTNPQIPFNMGLVYSDLAGGKNLTKDQVKEYEQKAEENYKKALELSGDNPIFNQQLAVLYFNKGVDLQKAAARLGTSKEDVAQNNKLINQRDAYFKKALPIFEKASSLFAARKASQGLTGEETSSYYTALQALGRIYSTTGNEAKAKEVLNTMKTLR